jgi:hypothetical protein
MSLELELIYFRLELRRKQAWNALLLETNATSTTTNN